MNSDFMFSTLDRMYSVRIPKHALLAALNECTASFPFETGGVLAGVYDKSCKIAEIKVFSPPPSDSNSTGTAFYRGISGLKKMFLALWQHEEYYLGEWHYHPNGSCKASSTDSAQMCEIANSDKWHCPEPVLIIIGRIPAEPMEIAVYVYPQKKQRLVQLDMIQAPNFK